MRRARGAAVVAVALAGLVALTLLAGAAPAAGQPGLFVGATDDDFLSRPASAGADARALGLGGFRVALSWTSGQTQMSRGDIADFDSMTAAAAGLRIVVTVYGKAVAAPLDSAGRDTYCAYLRDVLARYPMINDVVIWNEANLGFFWQPQFNADGTSAAPAAYEALLARCWDVLHALRPGVNLIMTTSPSGNDNPAAASNVSHSPASFVRKLGAAYRASGRSKPIFDTVGHNPYGVDSAESPWQQHLAPSHIAEGDVDRLVRALDDGFRGTPQAVPGQCVAAVQPCVSIWYLEAGYQTSPDAAHQQLYTGQENDAHAIPAAPTDSANGPTQSTQLAEGIELAYCQPYVGAFFNFLLRDEPSLARWQSGVLWADGSRKPSFDALQQTIGIIEGGRINCARLQAAHSTPIAPGADALVERIEWSPLAAFSVFNEIWGFSIDVRADATYRAMLLPVKQRVAAAGRQSALTTAGKLTHERPRALQFGFQRLQPGRYRIKVVVTRLRRPLLSVTRTSPTFTVE